MSLGLQILRWRRFKKENQQTLASKAGLTRATVSRIEQNRSDPRLSVLRRIAHALDLSVGTLVDESPPTRLLSRAQLDELATCAVNPSKSLSSNRPESRRLARAFRTWRKSIKTVRHTPLKKALEPRHQGQFALRKLRADLGEEQYQALLGKIQQISIGDCRE